MRTIARTATKKISAIREGFTACRAYNSSSGEMVSVAASHAWSALESYPKARLVESTDGDRYTVQVNGNHFYYLERPAN